MRSVILFICLAVAAGNICEDPSDRGPCKGKFPRWYFDTQTGACQQFVYGGCEGNKNNFLTKESCLTSCGATIETVKHKVASNRIPQCPPKEGEIGICVVQCEPDGKDDMACPDGKMCCSNGCGMVCKDPNETVKTKVARIPQCPPKDGEVGICVVECEPNGKDDMACPAGKLCCSNGCGMVCKDPNESLEGPYLEYYNKLQPVVDMYKRNDIMKTLWEKHVEMFKDVEPYYVAPPFSCQVSPSTGVPNSVNALRPQDVNVVAALGDSITAGNGVLANTPVDVIIQNRGHVWSAGGQVDYGVNNATTLANILRRFNSGIKGFSFGESFDFEDEAWLNVAVPGARAPSMLEQAQHLVEKIDDDNRIDKANDWKVVTLFIGGNDMCGYCREPARRTPEIFMTNVRNALDYLHQNLPRTLVNLVLMFDVTPLVQMSTGPFCDLLQDTMCGCATNDTTRQELKGVQLSYADALETMVNSGRFDTNADFTVVVQPYMRNAGIPRSPSGEPRRDYWSPDCFHPGTKAHYAMGLALWNNMLQPVGQKDRTLDWLNVNYVACPTTERPYIFTRQNSASRILVQDDADIYEDNF